MLTYFCYALGGLFAGLAFHPATSALVCGLSAAVLLTRHPMGALLSDYRWGWYYWFTAVDVAFGIFLLNVYNPWAKWAGLLAITAGALNLYCSFSGGWVHRLYDLVFGSLTVLVFGLLLTACALEILQA